MEPLDALAPQLGTPSPSTSLASAARDFEALVVHQLIRQASKPMFGETPLAGGSSGRMYRDLWFQELARLSELGLAPMIEREAGEP